MKQLSLKSLGLGVCAMTCAMTLVNCSPNEKTTVHYRDGSLMKAATEAAATDTKLVEQPQVAAVVEAGAEAKKNSAAQVSKGRKPASRGSVYTVQLGAFKVKDNASRMYEQLKAKGHPVELQSMHHSVNGELYLVRMVPVAGKPQAEEMARQLHASEAIQGHVMRVEAQ